MGTASRDPENFGTNALAFVGKQKTFENQISQVVPTGTDPSDAAYIPGLRKEIVEIRPPLMLQPFQNFYPADRLKGNPSPDRRVVGMKGGGGMAHFFADPGTLAFWLGELLMYDEMTSSIGNALPALSADLFANAAYKVDGTPLAAVGDAAQPFKQIETEGTSAGFMADQGIYSASNKRILYPSGLRAARLIFTFTGAAGGRIITLRGIDHNDTPLTDRILVKSVASSGTPVVKSSRWFKRVDEMIIRRSVSTGTGALGTVKVTADPETYYHELRFTKEVNEGLTMEVHEGNEKTPVTYAGGHIRRGVLAIEPVVRMLFDFIFNRAFPRQSIAGVGKRKLSDGTTEVAAREYDGAYLGTSPLTDTMGRQPQYGADSDTNHVDADSGYDKSSLYFKRRDPNFIPDWGMSWEVLDGDGVPDALVGQHRISTGNFVIDNMLGPPATRFAEDQTYPKSVRKANRDLLLAVQVDHNAKQDFDQFVGADDFQSVFSAVSRQFGQRYQAIRFSAENTQLIAYPARPIMTLAEVLANLAIRMNIGSSPVGNDEAVIGIFNDSATL